ncbi:MAG: PhoH family protein, partial [Acidobacteria bacterium]|nr:PhoH family protein [Acidobacteriota bacterium]
MSLEYGTPESTRVTTVVPNTHVLSGLLGPRDENLRAIERLYPATRVSVQGNQVTLEGPDATVVLRLLDELVLVLESGQSLDPTKIERTIHMVEEDLRPSEVLRTEVVRSVKGKPIRPSTAGQKRYTDAIESSIITFGIGPAGTGKSYLAVAAAVQALHRRQVQRIVLTRPAV